MQLDAIDSDSEIVLKALNYLKSKQNFDGTFNETKLTKIPSNPDETPRFREFHNTCFVFNAFIVNRDYIKQNFSDVMTRIESVLETKVISADNYDATYASYLFASNNKSSYAINIMKTVDKAAHTNGIVKYWNLKDKKEMSGSTKVLIASYAIMTYIKLNNTELAEPIIKWLIGEKDKNGNFHGVFDTNVALEALTEVESYSGVDRANILVKIIPEKSEIPIFVQMNTLLAPERINLPKTITSYSMEVEGEGFAMITTHYEYFMDVSKASEEFEIEADVKRINHTTSEVNLCGSYSGSLTRNSELIPMMEIEINGGFEYNPASDPMKNNENISVIIQKYLTKL